MPLADELFSKLVERAQEVAGQDWVNLRDASSQACRSMAEQLALIAHGRATGQITNAQAERHIADVRDQAMAMLAMVQMMTEAMAEQIVNSGLDAVKDLFNAAAGFKLIA